MVREKSVDFHAQVNEVVKPQTYRVTIVFEGIKDSNDMLLWLIRVCALLDSRPGWTEKVINAGRAVPLMYKGFRRFGSIEVTRNVG